MLLFFFFFFNDTATTEIYTLSLHDALPICRHQPGGEDGGDPETGRGAERRLADEAFGEGREGEERERAGEEQQGGVHGLAQRPAPALPSGRRDGAAEAEPGGGAERDRGQLGDAVGQDPGEEGERERVAEEDRG